jgi:pyruvate, water dikinase
MKPLIKRFEEILINDVPIVGGKNASLGEMYNKLSSRGIRVPPGFATTAFAFETFLEYNHLTVPLENIMKKLDRTSFFNLKETGANARKIILDGKLPLKLIEEILKAYKDLGNETTVAVRSSATAEDLPEASFAGQHESYLNVKGENDLLIAVKKCYASLYTDRAIKYREDKGFAHNKVYLSVGIQIMVRSDKASSGVGFTLDPESGFRNVIHLSGVWGLGENLVQGTVTPDEFYIFKTTLRKGKNSILQKKLGTKELTMVYDDMHGSSIHNLETPITRRNEFVLDDKEITMLANWCLLIEDHYQKPMDIEWAKDGLSGEMFILQARPETVHSLINPMLSIEYQLMYKSDVLCSGNAIGSKVATGIARILQSPKEMNKLRKGEIVVTNVTSPDWDPLLQKCAAIVTNKGGRTSHASIVARELGVPGIVGCGNATDTIRDGDEITVSCCEGKTGYIYKGKIGYRIKETDFSMVKKPEITKAMLIVGDPDQAFKLSFYPNDGVGLMRLEFIINHCIQVHPLALVHFDKLKDDASRKQIEELTNFYPDKKKYFVDKLAQGIAMIAAAFYPKDVIVRFSDFKTNEYANLVGGKEFEPHEENPMLGFRGASRYYHPLYKEAFRLECQAINIVRNEMGLDNIKLMIPFCRTIKEAHQVLDVLIENGLDRNNDHSLEVYMMAEIPSNVLLAEKFAELFDGFSIGSNDLTQLTLGIDRDSELVSDIFDEQDDAVKLMIGMMIEKARDMGVKIGLCGQAPSDMPQFAQFLVRKGINSISFNPDALLKGIQNINAAEQKHTVML